jgi:two-component system, LytTR family, response regulator AlgR
MKVLITDDEALARDRLRRLIEGLDGITVAGEAADGRQALEQCGRLQPDVVLLDIRMPGIDGLEAATHLAGWEQPPAVIFTTAYGDHALAAFEAHAVDYLLKPIRRERLQQALAKARGLNRARLDAARQLSDAAPRSHICARSGAQIRLIPLDEVLYFHADHKYVTVRHDGGEILIEESLKGLEQEFGTRFVRIHRNCLVARERISALERARDGLWLVRLHGADERLDISRRHLGSLRNEIKRYA